MSENPETKPLLVHFQPDVRSELERLAAEEERSMSYWIRRFVDEGIERLRHKERAA